MSSRRENVEALFEGALDLLPEDREAWLESRTDDEDVLAEVRSLLAASEREGILDRPSPGDTLARRWDEDAADEDDDLLPPGRLVGPYRIVREVGRGGMAVVYLAERSDAYQQAVAVKVIRSGPEGRELAQRFLAERQIMAALQHPNIARLLDGGVLPDGRPWLAMEYVQGLPVDVYCDRRRLPVEERLAIFCQVAWTIHHAHRNLVVHRDLKPSNILLTDAGDLRLLDFGIAKVLDPGMMPLHTVPMTRTGLRVMTPEYASPEQLRGAPVTTATDVYALGVVLYELLTGRRPFPSEGRTLTQLEHAVLHEEPPRPSTVVGRDGSKGPGILTPEDVALARGTSPWRLRRKLTGDLDRIVLTALRKDPERRYDSAQAMAADVQRYLEGRPLAARGDALPYRMGKFVARNRWWVGASAAFLLLLTGYATTITVEERRVRAALDQARLETERSEQVTQFLLQLFEGRESVLVDSLSARDLLARGMARADALHDQPAARAQMLDVVGRMHRFLGRYEEGAEVLERALALRMQLYGPAHPATAESMWSLADLYTHDGRLDEAERLYREALRVERALVGAEHPRVARSLQGLAVVLRDRGDHAAAEPLAREALAMRRRLHEGDDADLASGVHDLAVLLRRMGRHEEAEPLYREALDMRRRLLGDNHPEVAESLNDLAIQYEYMGRRAEAEPLLRQALESYRASLGPEHPEVATTLSNLAVLLSRKGDWAEADALFTESLAIRRRALGTDHPAVGGGLSAFAGHLRRAGDLRGAELRYLEALDVFRRAYGTAHPALAEVLHGLATLYREMGEPERAAPRIAESLEIRRATVGNAHPATAAALHEAGVVGVLRGDRQGAEAALRDALEIRRGLYGDDHPSVRETSLELVRLYEAWGRPQDAEPYRALSVEGGVPGAGDAAASAARGGAADGR